MLTTIRFGPKDHGRLVSDEELQVADYRLGYVYEVIFGRLYVSPAPNPEHDVVEKHILEQLFQYAREHRDVVAYVTDGARVFVPGVEKTTAPEPDLALFASKPTSDWREVSPFVVGEVLRGDSVDKDLFRNVELYLRVPSIQEYWVFDIRHDPKRPTLLVHRRAGDQWDLLEFGPDVVYETAILPGLKLVISPGA